MSLHAYRLVYLATPYSKYPAGIEAAFREASRIAARMLTAGVPVYSPIAHTHPIAEYGNLNPYDHDIWLPFDQAMMDAADACVVADMGGWAESKGIAYEIDYFTSAGKPVHYMNAETLEIAR
jgi:nucleoside 2-deoxyribosyltransferase